MLPHLESLPSESNVILNQPPNSLIVVGSWAYTVLKTDQKSVVSLRVKFRRQLYFTFHFTPSPIYEEQDSDKTVCASMLPYEEVAIKIRKQMFIQDDDSLKGSHSRSGLWWVVVLVLVVLGGGAVFKAKDLKEWVASHYGG